MGTTDDDYVKLDLKKSEKGEDERKAIATRTMHEYMVVVWTRREKKENLLHLKG